MSGTARPLLPSSTPATAGNSSSDNNNNNNPSQNPPSRPKRTLIESACAACRKRKSRCDGGRPVCGRCRNLHTECVYEAEEGESRWSALKRRNTALETERDELIEVFSILRSRPESESMELLRHIRTGSDNDLSQTLRQVRDGSALSGGPASPRSVTSTSGGEQRLPGIQTMFDVAGSERGPAPMDTSRDPRRQSIGSDRSNVSNGSMQSYSSTRSVRSTYDQPQPSGE